MACDAQMEKFLAQGGEKRDREQEAATRKRNLGRQKPLAKQSLKQKLIEAKLAGIKEGFIFLTRRLDPDGLHCWNCGRPCNESELDLHHVRPRGSGGEHKARNLELWCRFPCHAGRHGQPEWSTGDPIEDATGEGRR